jgi:predicted DNA-binding transcriptional regulator YafY
MALADLLRGREATSVGALAEELGVSRHTLLRDLAALRERGMPITGESGPGGGGRPPHLERGRGDLDGGPAITGASDLPWGQAATSGMAKLLGSLPQGKVQALRRLCRRVIVGQPVSASVRAGAGAPPAELRLFEEAFSTGLGLGFRYTDSAGQRSTRRVEPHGLLVETPVWYILARDVDKGEPRMFRMDQIARPRLLPDLGFRPDLQVIRAVLPGADRWHPLTGRWSA